MPRTPQTKAAPGLYQQKGRKSWWLRYSLNGKQIRVPLGTTDYADAVRIAEEKRGKPLPGSIGTPILWDKAVAKYIATGLATRRFRKNTGDTIEYAAKAFQTWSGVSSPQEVTSAMLQAFYDLHAGKRKPTKGEKAPAFTAVATAQGYVSKLGTFLRRNGVPVKVVFGKEQAKRRDVVVAKPKVMELIDGCSRPDIKFVLFAGFHAGLRKEEIIMARPEWFKMHLGYVEVPNMQLVDGRHWEVKSGRSRKVPLTPEFRKFLEEEFVDWTDQSYMLHPEAKGERYRWDPRRPYEEYMASAGMWKKDGTGNVTMHSMRHTYITHLADDGFSAAQISAWSGDRIRTLETNYLHTSAPEGAVMNLYGSKKKLTLEDLARKLDQRQGGEPVLVWTDQVPLKYTAMYTVENALTQHHAFSTLFPDDQVTDHDWEDGHMSTRHARLVELESHGWIRRLRPDEL